MTDFTRLSDGVADAVQTLSPSLYRVAVGRRFSATATAWSEALLVTVAHAVDTERGFKVFDGAGAEVAVELVGVDRTTDLALLRVDGEPPPLPTWTEDEEPRVGHLVLAHALSRRGPRAALGVVSAVGEAWRTRLGGDVSLRVEVDGPLPDGGSGGPLTDAAGRILGLNTAGLVRGGTTVPTATVRRVIEQLSSPGGISRGRLGVAVQRVAVRGKDAAAAGRSRALLLIDLEEDGPAAAAGLHLGDALLKVDGQEVGRFADLAALLITRGGKQVPVQVLRAGQVVELPVSLEARPRARRN